MPIRSRASRPARRLAAVPLLGLCLGPALAAYGWVAGKAPPLLAELFPGQLTVLVGLTPTRSAWVLLPDVVFSPRVVTLSGTGPVLQESLTGFLLLAAFYGMCAAGAGWLWFGSPLPRNPYTPQRSRHR